MDVTVVGRSENGHPTHEFATFEEAFQMTGHGRFNYQKLLLGGLCLCGIIMESLEIGYILPIIECEFKLSFTEKGLLTSAIFIGIVCSSHMWGYLADCKGRRGVMLPGIGIGAICSIISSFAPTAWFLILMRILTGFFISSSSIIYAYVGELHIDKERSKAIARVSIFISIAMMSLPAIGWVIIPFDWKIPIDYLGIEYSSWRLYILVCSLPNIIASVVLFKSPESPKFLKAVGRSEEALSVLKLMHDTNNKGMKFQIKHLTGDLNNVQKSNGFWSSLSDQTIPLFQLPLLPCTLMACFGQFTVFFLSSGFYLWIPDILNKLMLVNNLNPHPMTLCEALNDKIIDVEIINETATNFIDSNCSPNIADIVFEIGLGMSLIFFLGYMFTGFAIAKIGKKTLLAFTLGLPALCTLGLFWADDIYTIIIFCVALLCSGCAGGLVTSVAVDLFPTKLRGMAMSLQLMCGRIGAVAGTNLVGYMFKTSCDSTFLVFGAEVLLYTACIALWPKPETIKEKLAKKGIEF